MTVEMAMVMANCLKNCPVRLFMKASGTNTATRVAAIATMGPLTSRMA
jgi:hypothetical protein